ncbi:hypothetical protein KBB96_14500 [Luteolibacter ambystomatis]|uniref:Uncharacterized protein n=1 Tax=Luteolibacter ambystomatis TaxID=2824561 RepID=A0A975G6X6_9BACT|nr:hypothetical protein [Luteolibacter ambystomatis]QUE50073.1 hypothetical protein KBB96_14500 [Luteolibacter ambystomatis]
MAKTFGILTFLVLAASAFVGFKNKEKYDAEIHERQTAEQRLDKSKVRLKKAQDDLAATTAKRKETEAEVARLNTEKASLTEANNKIKADVEAKTAEVEANKAKLTALKEKLESAGDLQTLGPKMKATTAQIEELTQTINTSNATLANLTAESGRLDKVIANLRAIGERYPAKKSDPALKTRISAIYPNWGFVTLASGNTGGVVANSNLKVVRDGETIAKLQVTATEAGTSSASIVPESLKTDTVLMVGDLVQADTADK